jgi:hypothetical protein
MSALATPSNYLLRSSGIAPASGDYSCVFWARPHTSPTNATGKRRTYLAFLGGANEFAGIFTSPASNSTFVSVADGSTSQSTTTASMDRSQWYPVGYVREGTTHRFYRNMNLIASATLDISGNGWVTQSLGNDGIAGTFDGIELYGFREWTKALDLTALRAEWNAASAVDTDNLWSDTPLGDDLLDVSGNGRDWVWSQDVLCATFADSAEGLVRTSGISPSTSNFSFSGWFYVPTDPSAGEFRSFLYRGNDPATYTEFVWIGQHDDGTLELTVGPNPSDFGPAITSGWHCIQYSYSATTKVHTVYLDAVSVITRTRDVGGFTFTHEYIGTDTYAADWQPSDACYVREWQASLTAAQLADEAYQVTPFRWLNLWLDTPLIGNANDYSGNSRNWADDGGTVTYATVPPISSMPDTFREWDSALPVSDTWAPTNAYEVITIRYTALAKGVLGEYTNVSSPSGNFLPQTIISQWVNGVDDTVNFLDDDLKAFMVPVNAGELYYITSRDNSLVNPPGRSVTFSLIDGPDNVPADPTGVIFITDDAQTNGWLTIASLVSPTTGEILKEVRDIPPSEDGVASPVNGNIILTGKGGAYLGNVYFYDNTLTLLSTDTTTLSASGQEQPPTAATPQFFYAAQYVAGDGAIRVRRWDLDGVKDSAEWDIPLPPGWVDVTDIAVSFDDGILYYTYFPAQEIQAWDLNADASLGVFYNTFALDAQPFIIDYSSDNLIYVAESDLTNDIYRVLQLDTSGTLLQAWTLDPSKGSVTDQHFAMGVDDTVSFWVYQQVGTPSPSSNRKLLTLREYRIADGSIINDLQNVLDYTDGISNDIPIGDEPASRFGVAKSCPLIIMQLGGVIPPVCPGIITAGNTALM